jgi:hypothetical protein
VLRRWRAPHAYRSSRLSGRFSLVSVILDRAGSLEVLEDDCFDVEGQVDLIADDHAAAWDFVLPGNAEVVSVDPGGRLEADPAHIALVLLSGPEGCLPLSEVVDVERDCSRHAADRQLDLALEGRAAGAIGEAAAEVDLGVILDVEEVGAAEMLVPRGLAGPDPGRIDLALEGRLQAAVPAARGCP